MPALIDITGLKYGRLLVVSRAKNINGRTAYNCICDCGKSTVATANDLRRGHTSSCGCLHKEKVAALNRTHGMGYECREYRSWNAAKKRCRTKSNKSFKCYGAAGVDMCDEWAESFEKFLADMGRCPDGMTLDRINPFGNYEPGKCRWADRKTQNNNQRRHYARKESSI